MTVRFSTLWNTLLSKVAPGDTYKGFMSEHSLFADDSILFLINVQKLYIPDSQRESSNSLI